MRGSVGTTFRSGPGNYRIFEDYDVPSPRPANPPALMVRLFVDPATGKLTAIDSNGNNAFPSGGGTPAGIQGDVQFNNNGVFGTADSVAPGCSVNLDTNIGSGLAITIVNGGVTITQDLDFSVVAAAASFECTGGNLQFTADTGDIDFQAMEGNIRFEVDGAASQMQLNAPHVNIPSLQIFANNAAAIAGGLIQGDLYRTGADPDVVCIVH
jgi:hypothetical protein